MVAHAEETGPASYCTVNPQLANCRQGHCWGCFPQATQCLNGWHTSAYPIGRAEHKAQAAIAGSLLDLQLELIVHSGPTTPQPAVHSQPCHATACKALLDV
jgi:hypothetical protein